MKNFWVKHKRINIIILKLGLMALLIFNLYSKFHGDESGVNLYQTIDLFKEQFSFSKIHFLFFVILLTFINWAFESLKFYICVEKLEKISYWTAYRGILFGNAMNLILPASIGELTGRPMVLKEENRIAGSGIAYYVSIVQKVASPLVGFIFLLLAHQWGYLSSENITILGITIGITSFLAVIAIADFSFWAMMYLYPESMISLLAKIGSFRSIFEKIGQVIHFRSQIRWKLLAIGCIRFFIFVTQYWLLMFLFFDHFPQFEFFMLCGVYFLAQFVIPSLGFLDVGIRANIVIFVFSLYTKNVIQLLAVNYIIWIINLLIPSLIGFYLMRKVINPFEMENQP